MHALLTNSRGDYVALGAPNASNYHGFFIREGATYYKILANILPKEALTGMHVGKTITREFGSAQQHLTLRENGLIVDCEGTFLLTLDCKQLYDESDDERSYDVSFHEGTQHDTQTLGSTSVLRIVYKKRDDYTIYITVATTLTPSLHNAWRDVRYTYDEARGTASTPWVYDVASLSGNGRVAIAAGTSRKETEQAAFSLLMEPSIAPRHTPAPRAQAQEALLALARQEGVMAGLPWFFKEWSRDELIACGGLLSLGNVEEVHQILDKWYAAAHEDGTLPAIFPDEGLTSVDAPGWLARRTIDFLASVDTYDDLADTLPRWRDTMGRMIAQLPIRDGLVHYSVNETWMDTAFNDDGRAGFRVEIQALACCMCDAHALLCSLTGRRSQWSDLREQLEQTIRERLVQENVLLDGLSENGAPDYTVRPNVFLAWYALPELFSQEEWRGFFQHVLSHCWLAWGGLSSISQQDSRFHSHDTGENVAAYHRGDSWYYVNNIAALALADVGGFSRYVVAIRRASTADLREGFLGHCSEISSAATQEARGCWAQAWSASTLVELLSR